MIERLIRYSATNRFIVLLIIAGLLVAGIWSINRIALDALPDLSDTQVIVYSTWDRSPDIIEDQVTYPIVTALLGAPRVKAVRGISDVGASYIYVVFDDGGCIEYVLVQDAEGFIPVPWGVVTVNYDQKVVTVKRAVERRK